MGIFLFIFLLYIIMKYIILSLLVVFLLLVSGCSSYFSNLQTPQKTLDIRETAVFSQEKTQFSATLNSVGVSQKTSFPREVTVRMTVKNTGNEAFSLIGYPRLVDAGGKEYVGRNLMFGGINPGGMATGTSVIRIESAQDYSALEESALLKVRYQSMKPLPYEGIWHIDLSAP
jgi:uncharacterized protein YceK